MRIIFSDTGDCDVCGDENVLCVEVWANTDIDGHGALIFCAVKCWAEFLALAQSWTPE